MARSPFWWTTINGFNSITTTTSFLTLSPTTIPEGATLTRIVGQMHFDFAPDPNDTSSPAALIVAALGVFSVPEAIDPANPNDFPHVFLWWRYQVVRAHQIGISGAIFTPRSTTVDLDVHGQRQMSVASSSRLRLWVKLITPLTGSSTPVASLRFGLRHLYLNPATP